MEKELVEAKLNQLLRILGETESWLAVPLAEFSLDTKLIRACQRNLQLLLEYASDINVILILEGNQKVPGSYRESFTVVFGMDLASALSLADRDALLASVDWRNELIHEYEPEASNDVFYATLKQSLVASHHNPLSCRLIRTRRGVEFSCNERCLPFSETYRFRTARWPKLLPLVCEDSRRVEGPRQGSPGAE